MKIRIMIMFIIMFAVLSFSNISRIEGIVFTEDMQPAQYASIDLQKYNENTSVATIQTDGTGYFVFTDIPYEPNGYNILIYTVTDYPSQYWYSKVTTVGRPNFPIKFKDNGELFLKIILNKNPLTSDTTTKEIYYSSIVGKLLYDSTNQTAGNTTVSLINKNTMQTEGSTVTGPDGNFLIDLVGRNFFNEYYLNIKPYDTKYPEQYWHHKGTTEKPLEIIIPDTFNTIYLNDVFIKEVPDTNDTTNNTVNILKVLLLEENSGVPLTSECGVFAENVMDEKITAEIQYIPNNNGEVYLELPMPGDYFVGIRNSAGGYPDQYYSTGTNTKNPIYPINAFTETTSVTIQLTMNPQDTIFNENSAISGIITNENNMPVKDVYVWAISEYEFNNYYDFLIMPNMGTMFSAKSDLDGRFIISNVPEGKYYIVSFSFDNNVMPQFYPGTLKKADAKTLSVNSGDTSIINIYVKQGSVIEGYVKDNMGNGVANIFVEMWPQTWDNDSATERPNFSFRTYTDSTGKYVFYGIPPSKWYCFADDENQIYYRVDTFDISFDVKNIGEKIIATNNFIMEIGAKLTGTIEGSFTNQSIPVDIAVYPLESLTEVSTDDVYKIFQRTANIQDSMGTLKYVSGAFPQGEWKISIVMHPTDAAYNPDNFNSLNFIQSPGWKFIDNSTDVNNTTTYKLVSGMSYTANMSFKNDGYTIFGELKPEGGEVFGPNGELWGRIFAFVYINGHLIKVGESEFVDKNKFALPGLRNGESYYLFADVQNYSPQWWITSLKDTATAIFDHASKYTFSSTQFERLIFPVVKNPEGDYDKNFDTAPLDVPNQKLKPAGFGSIFITWDEPGAKYPVVKYRIGRLDNLDDPYKVFKHVEDHFEPINGDSLDKVVKWFETANKFFLDTTVSPFVKYMYVVFAVDSLGQEGRALIDTIPLENYCVKIDETTLITKTLFPKEKWIMAGNCFSDTLFLPDSVIAYRWNENADSSQLLYKYQPIKKLSQTQGAWIYALKELDTLALTKLQILSLYTNKNNIYVTLDSGWNQISSPFPFEVSPKWLNTVYDAYVWNAEKNGYELATYLKPWHAYWIYSKSAAKIQIEPLSLITKNIFYPRKRRSYDFELNIALTSSVGEDRDNYIGITTENRGDSPAYVSYEPPFAFNDVPSFYFTDGEYRYARLFKQRVDNKPIIWKAALSKSEEKCTLDFKVNFNRDGYVVIWRDKEKEVIITRDTSIEIAPHKTVEYGYIIVANSLNDVGIFSKTKVLAFGPNPVQKDFFVKFVVPYNFNSAELAEKTEVAVYDIKGRKISTLLNKKLLPGIYSVHYNTTKLGAGIYFIAIKNSVSSKYIRLTKLK